ncbi:hypothetical protein RJ639_028717 [Escallonia herrerae]|uniref:DNA repair protein RAD4 n=1 Tax=Escallonia herrerae TaxID=1293975 RepID=A0AA89BJZ9_9ASTE|nr:hypothetical protein RJ639_028717 [Escallonia herrerae]
MRTRKQAKRRNQSTEKAVGRLLKRATSRGSRGLKNQDTHLRQCDSAGKGVSTGNDNQVIHEADTQSSSEAKGVSRDALQNVAPNEKAEGGSYQHAIPASEDEMDESVWEDGAVATLKSTSSHAEGIVRGVTIEFDSTPDSGKRKNIRRASAEEKELAELVHKVHLLCLLGRGRLIDIACNDPLIQASLLSLLPTYLLKVSEVPKLTANALAPLVNWFHNNFRVRSSSCADRSFQSALAFAIETREGTSEEIAALSVALFRALNLTTRFVSILDVVSLKPDAGKSESISPDTRKRGTGIFKSSTLMVARPNQVLVSPGKESAHDEKDGVCETSLRGREAEVGKPTRSVSRLKDSVIAEQLDEKTSDSLVCEAQNGISGGCITTNTGGSKRKGDVEFETQLEMALSATAAGISKSNMESDMKILHSNSSTLSSPFKRVRKIGSEESSSSFFGISTAVGSRKMGPPLYWAEVYCSQANLTGKWMHVDAVNALIDGEQKVEAAAAACKTFLRYVVAFAGHGAKDVTRRYCMKWYKIASQRINPMWWDAVLAPLKQLESGATGELVHLKEAVSKEHDKVKTSSDPSNVPGSPAAEVSKEDGENFDAESSTRNFIASRTSLEDMDLETRALTEPLPTNQQAYKNHHLYALERWLTKYQILHPKGPVLGFCSGHPVYPRTCVQTLHTKERWLREGLQVKSNELPAKVLKRSLKPSKGQAFESDHCGEVDRDATIALYGKWQIEPLCLPAAVDGIVPKNERGQVDVWSEKCLPPGTVHLGLPRVFNIAKRLGIDFAPAMVGFEFQHGRSIPVYDGIVVCAEFKDAILEAYAEVEERREAEERKQSEAEALSRWYQLLSSIVIRQDLEERYGKACHHMPQLTLENSMKIYPFRLVTARMTDKLLDASKLIDVTIGADHEHVFLTDDQTFDEESSTRTKLCRCGFRIQVEEL